MGRPVKKKLPKKKIKISINPKASEDFFLRSARDGYNPYFLITIFMEEYGKSNPLLAPFILFVKNKDLKRSNLVKNKANIKEIIELNKEKYKNDDNLELVNGEQITDLDEESLMDLIEDLWK